MRSSRPVVWLIEDSFYPGNFNNPGNNKINDGKAHGQTQKYMGWKKH
jgi:hypothetical protein